MQDHSVSIANALELLQSCTKPSICEKILAANTAINITCTVWYPVVRLAIPLPFIATGASVRDGVAGYPL